jgi:chromate reductase
MKVLAFAASNSRQSINHKLVIYAVKLIKDYNTAAEIDLIRINDYEMPLFSIDRENELGQPPQAKAFHQKISETDLIVISFAEHNGSYSAAYKNLFDWTSRIDAKVFQNKSLLLLSTSPGPGGAGTVLNQAVTSAPFFSGKLKASLSVGSFFDNFDAETNIISNQELNQKLIDAIKQLSE